MNLRKIIQESINNVIYQNIISEAIDEVVNERQKFGRKGRNATNRQPKPINNLQSVRKQNARQRQTQNVQQTNQTTPTGQQSQNTQNTQQQPQNTQQIQKPDYIQYAQQIQQLIGKTGIDPSPVKSNESAAKHVEDLNNFLFNVLDAIYDGNVTPQDTTNLAKNGIGGYRRDLSDVGMNASSGIINYLGNNAERAMQATPGLNQIMGGVFGAGVNAYNKSHNQFARAMDNRGNSNGYSRPGGVHSITPLTQLFAPSGEFNRLYTNYQQINTANGNILNTIPAIPQVYGILNNLRQEVMSGSNQQATTQPQNGQQPGNTQPNNTTGNTQSNNQGNEPTNDEPDYNYLVENFEDIIFGEEFFQNAGQILASNTTRRTFQNVEDAFYAIALIVMDSCRAIRSGKITGNEQVGEEYRYVIPLVEVLGLAQTGGNKFGESVKSYKKYKKILDKIPKVSDMMSALINLRNKMVKCGVNQ